MTERTESDPPTGDRLAADILAACLAGGRSEPTPEELGRLGSSTAGDLIKSLAALRDIDAAVAAAEEPAEFGEFRLLREIGRGGMGIVFAADQPALSRRVAVKMLLRHSALDDRAIDRFQREARTAAALRHPGIVGVHGVGEVDGTHYIAMELVEGAPLDRVIGRLRDIPVDARTGRDFACAVQAETVSAGGSAAVPFAWDSSYSLAVLDLSIRVTEALHFAHERGIVHRDVKPSNILVCPDGRAVLTDFGLAREIEDVTLTAAGEFAGTPYYVSPEQASARRSVVDPRSDVFSFGATLYELLVGVRAFERGSTPEVIDAIRRTTPLEPRRVCPSLAAELSAVVMKALERDPADRYVSARALADDLRAFRDYRPVCARPVSWPRRARRWIRENRVLAALVATLICAFGFASYALLHQREIAAGAATLRRVQIEDELSRAFLELGEGSDDLALSLFAGLVEDGCLDPIALVGQAMAFAELDRFVEAERLVAVRADATSRRVHAWILRQMGRDADAASIERSLATPTSAAEFFVAGMIEIERGHATLDLDAYRRAREFLESARSGAGAAAVVPVAVDPRPRALARRRGGSASDRSEP